MQLAFTAMPSPAGQRGRTQQELQDARQEAPQEQGEAQQEVRDAQQELRETQQEAQPNATDGPEIRGEVEVGPDAADQPRGTSGQAGQND